jgi:hypothetical protein
VLTIKNYVAKNVLRPGRDAMAADPTSGRDPAIGFTTPVEGEYVAAGRWRLAGKSKG